MLLLLLMCLKMRRMTLWLAMLDYLRIMRNSKRNSKPCNQFSSHRSLMSNLKLQFKIIMLSCHLLCYY